MSLREASFRLVLFRLFFISRDIFGYFVFLFLVAILLSLSATKRQNNEKTLKPKDEITPKRNVTLKAFAKMHLFFLVCCTVDNVNVEANMWT